MKQQNRLTMRALVWAVLTAGATLSGVGGVGCSAAPDPLVTVAPRGGGGPAVGRLAGVDASWDQADAVGSRVARFEPRPLVTQPAEVRLGATGEVRLGLAGE